MNIGQAKDWVAHLNAHVQAGNISQYDANDEVFAEMENGDHDAATETFFYEYTQGQHREIGKVHRQQS